MDLRELDTVLIRQKKELAELFGFETRNKYSIETADGRQIGFIAEQQKGVLGFMFRQLLGHWRSFELHVFDPARNITFVARHPFRLFFQRLEVSASDGRPLGTCERKFSLLTKSFDISNSSGELLFTVRSPIWRLWTFAFMRGEQQMAVIKKKWGGLLKEAFIDADSFEVIFEAKELTEDQKILVVVTGVYIDLMFFEKKAGR